MLLDILKDKEDNKVDMATIITIRIKILSTQTSNILKSKQLQYIYIDINS